MSTPSTSQKAADPKQADEQPQRDVMAWVKNIAVFVGLASAVIGLLFLFLPDLKPEPSPASSGAGLTSVLFDPDTSRQEYLDRTDQDRQGFTPPQLARRGAFALFTVALEGFKGKPLTLKRELLDTATGKQLSEERAITITPPQNEVTRDWHYWVALPVKPGTYVMVLQLLANGEDAALATLETPKFPGLSGRR